MSFMPGKVSGLFLSEFASVRRTDHVALQQQLSQEMKSLMVRKPNEIVLCMVVLTFVSWTDYKFAVEAAEFKVGCHLVSHSYTIVVLIYFSQIPCLCGAPNCRRYLN